MAFRDKIFNLFETIVRNWLTGFLHRYCRKQRAPFQFFYLEKLHLYVPIVISVYDLSSESVNF
ncbi:unnamed protein product [Brugia timori]|uniref:Uncharacterized protein n=1 Tax=Brugia timori TaxID=42155 RepID=A0A0R3QZU7_9BILA|nr:unnamed protein product [Brugia timori]